ncbi:MAG: dihydroorotate dehydrogenase-like protein [Bacteroidales bacterium]|jgi:dihydroorotate dehydrogenase (fumarate)|nr:dihydroorotate dehydrogenase-like protein [Bacteroidales bacterium]
MENLRTNYLGLNLKSPVILGSSGLSKKIDNLKIAEKNGVGAIVLKSLFEEQINYESDKTISQNLIDFHSANDYILNYSKLNSLNEYADFIKRAKDAVSIPIIASINCSHNIEWGDFAERIENAGADALELNMNVLAFDADKSASDIEEEYYQIAEHVKNSTKLNIACKLGNNFTNLPYFIKQLSFRGINSFVLFNKFFEPVIDIKKEAIKSSALFSTDTDIKQSIRKIAVTKGLLPDIEISGSTGVHSADGLIQQILAGATTVQLCSVLYKKGVQEIGKIIEGLEKWMEEKSYSSIEDFRGKLSYCNIDNPQLYERYQFIKYFTSVE